MFGASRGMIGSVVTKYLATRHNCSAIRTVEGHSRLSIIGDNAKDMRNVSSEAGRRDIIAFEVSKASLTVHCQPNDRQVAVPDTDAATTKVLKVRSRSCPPRVICEVSVGELDQPFPRLTSCEDSPPPRCGCGPV